MAYWLTYASTVGNLFTTCILTFFNLVVNNELVEMDKMYVIKLVEKIILYNCIYFILSFLKLQIKEQIEVTPKFKMALNPPKGREVGYYTRPLNDTFEFYACPNFSQFHI